jgi:hypothetical protein
MTQYIDPSQVFVVPSGYGNGSSEMPEGKVYSVNPAFDAPSAPMFDAPPSVNDVNGGMVVDEVATREYLTAKGWPPGLQSYLLRNVQKMPYRFFICDDSGSMSTNDGHRLVGSGANTKVVSCTRWTEMTESLRFHIGLAQALNVSTEFRLLNSAAPINVGCCSAPESASVLTSLLEDSPGE